jgi:hypothetical protein
VQLCERRFDDLSQLRYQIFTCELGGEHSPIVLVLAFSGTYGDGTLGNGDADYMRVITQAALSLWDVHGVVFDLRELRYCWGNGIWAVFGRGLPSSGAERYPRALVVSDLCRDGFSTCAGLVPPMFDRLEEAIEYLSPLARSEAERLA